MTPLHVGGERANDAPKTNSEVRGEDRVNDTSNNSEVLKENVSAAADNTVSLSLNQGMDIMIYINYCLLYLSVLICKL